MTASGATSDLLDTSDHWRMFVALEVPASVREQVGGALGPVVEANRAHLRFPQPDSWHVTLAFLGGIHPSWADAIEATLTRAVQHHPVFDVALGRAGRFGRGILFLGFDDASYAAVRRLGEDIRQGLADQGVPFDTKALHPHLTLARQRDRRGLGVSRSRLAEVDAALAPVIADAHWPVRAVALLRSHLEPEGARYEPLTRIALPPERSRSA